MMAFDLGESRRHRLDGGFQLLLIEIQPSTVRNDDGFKNGHNGL